MRRLAWWRGRRTPRSAGKNADADQFEAATSYPTCDCMGKDNPIFATFPSNGSGLDACGVDAGIVSTAPDHAGGTGLSMEMDGTSMASRAVCGTLAAILSKASGSPLPFREWACLSWDRILCPGSR